MNNDVSARLRAARLGVARGLAELRHSLRTPEDLFGYIAPTLILLIVIFFMRGATVPGTDFSLGARTLASALGMNIAFGGLITVAQQLTVDREDGTLLRAKATPNGMLGYLLGKITYISVAGILSLLVQLVCGLFVVDGFGMASPAAWLTLAWVIALGMVATMPIGAVFGSLFASPRSLGIVMLPLMALVATSGIFYPITSLPGWLQGVAQVFPVYWLGLGMRSAMLPADLAAVELGGSWRHLETFGALGAWAVLGLVLAPIVLRRMARRESGSSVEERRQKAMQRVRP